MKTQSNNQKTFSTPDSVESAAQDIKRAKSVIKSKQDELENIKANGLTFHGSIEFSNYDSLAEMGYAINKLIEKHGKFGDLAVKWDGDVATYTYPANAEETAKAIQSIQNRIAELEAKVDFLKNFISEKMEQIRIDLDLRNFYNS